VLHDGFLTGGYNAIERVNLSENDSHKMQTVADPGFAKGGWRARGARAYRGLGAEAPAGSRGKDHGGGQGANSFLSIFIQKVVKC